MTEAKDVVEGLLTELERYLGPAMVHIPNVSKAKDWLERQEQNKGRVNLVKF